jgi:hypothetical protein
MLRDASFFSAMFQFYILYSKTSVKYYIGYSDNPGKRLIEHNSKEFNSFTKKQRSRLKTKIKTASFKLINPNYYLLMGVPVLSTDFSGIPESVFASIFPVIFKEIGETVAFE